MLIEVNNMKSTFFVFIIILSFCPKLMFLIASIPGPIMWGTVGAMSIMVLMSGLRSMHHLELTDRNILIIGVPVFITVCVSIFNADSLELEEAKDIHTSLRKAAGLMKFVQDTMIPQMVEKTKDGSGMMSAIYALT